MTDSVTTSRSAWGWGLATVHQTTGLLDTYYPAPALGQLHECPDILGRGDDRAGDDRREEPQHLAEERCDQDGEQTRCHDGAQDGGQSRSGRLLRPRPGTLGDSTRRTIVLRLAERPMAVLVRPFVRSRSGRRSVTRSTFL